MVRTVASAAISSAGTGSAAATGCSGLGRALGLGAGAGFSATGSGAGSGAGSGCSAAGSGLGARAGFSATGSGAGAGFSATGSGRAGRRGGLLGHRLGGGLGRRGGLLGHRLGGGLGRRGGLPRHRRGRGRGRRSGLVHDQCGPGCRSGLLGHRSAGVGAGSGAGAGAAATGAGAGVACSATGAGSGAGGAGFPAAAASLPGGPSSRRPPAAWPRGACRGGPFPRAVLPRCRPNPRRKCSCSGSRAHTRFVSERYARRGIARAGGWPPRGRSAGRGLCWRRDRSGRCAGADSRPLARAFAQRQAHCGVAARARIRGAVPDGRVAGARRRRLQGGGGPLRLAARLRRLCRAERGDGGRCLAAARTTGRRRPLGAAGPPARPLARGLPRRSRGHA